MGISARTVAAPPFSPEIQARFPGTTRTRDQEGFWPVRLPRRASNSSIAIRIEPKRLPQSIEDRLVTPCALRPEDSKSGKLHSKILNPCGNRQSIINSSVTTILFHFGLVISATILARLWRQITVEKHRKLLIARTIAVWRRQ